MNLDRYQLILFDADGTLRRTTVPGQVCPNKPGEWEVIPEAQAWFNRHGPFHPQGGPRSLRVGIASNQGGVGLGFLGFEVAHSMLRDLYQALTGHPAPAGSVLICPHRPVDECYCRKPSPGLLDEMCRFYAVERSRTLYVGDMESDQEAARRAFIDFVWAEEFFGGQG